MLDPSRISRIQMLKLQSIGHIIPIIVLKVLKAYCKYLILLDVKLLAYDKISNHGNVISLVRLHVHDTLCSYTEYCNMTHRPFCNSRQLLWTVQHALPTCAPWPIHPIRQCKVGMFDVRKSLKYQVHSASTRTL